MAQEVQPLARQVVFLKACIGVLALVAVILTVGLVGLAVRHANLRRDHEELVQELKRAFEKEQLGFMETAGGSLAGPLGQVVGKRVDEMADANYEERAAARRAEESRAKALKDYAASQGVIQLQNPVLTNAEREKKPPEPDSLKGGPAKVR